MMENRSRERTAIIRPESNTPFCEDLPTSPRDLPGSASYEMLSNLVARFPVIFTPREVRSLCQPVSIRDVVDFWRVEDSIPSKRLLLRAEMKLPGKAWLEFHIGDHGDRREMSLTARYLTTTLFGRAGKARNFT